MSLLLGFLTFVMVLNCLFLMLLILIQLPKKEAGAGIAFGGAATDALFGAGSGNALTQLTKYSGTFFVVLAIVLSVLNMNAARQGSRKIQQELSRQAGMGTLPAAGTTVTNVRSFTSTNPVTTLPAITPETPVTPAPAAQPE